MSPSNVSRINDGSMGQLIYVRQDKTWLFASRHFKMFYHNVNTLDSPATSDFAVPDDVITRYTNQDEIKPVDRTADPQIKTTGHNDQVDPVDKNNDPYTTIRTTRSGRQVHWPQRFRDS